MIHATIAHISIVLKQRLLSLARKMEFFVENKKPNIIKETKKISRYCEYIGRALINPRIDSLINDFRNLILTCKGPIR